MSEKKPWEREKIKVLGKTYEVIYLSESSEESLKTLEDKQGITIPRLKKIYILKELKKATQKYTWKEIEDKLKGNKIIKKVNSKDKTIEIEVKE